MTNDGEQGGDLIGDPAEISLQLVICHWDFAISPIIRERVRE
jgi:hypothetical protein